METTHRMEAQELLDIIGQYQETHPSWHSDFVDALRSWYEKTGNLSYRQICALESVIEKNLMISKDSHWYDKKNLPWD